MSEMVEDGNRKRRERSPTVASSPERSRKRSPTVASDSGMLLGGGSQQFSSQTQQQFSPQIPDDDADAGDVFVGFYGDRTKYTIKLLHKDASDPVEILIQIHLREGETENPRKEEQSGVGQAVQFLIQCLEAEKKLRLQIPGSPSKEQSGLQSPIPSLEAQKQHQQTLIQSLIQCVEDQKQLCLQIPENPSNEEHSLLQSLKQCLEFQKQLLLQILEKPSKDQSGLQFLIQSLDEASKQLRLQIPEHSSKHNSDEKQVQAPDDEIENPTSGCKGETQIHIDAGGEGETQIPEDPRKDKSDGGGGQAETQIHIQEKDKSDGDDGNGETEIQLDDDSYDHERNKDSYDLRDDSFVTDLIASAEAMRKAMGEEDCDACNGPHLPWHCPYLSSIPQGAKYNTRKYEVLCCCGSLCESLDSPCPSGRHRLSGRRLISKETW